MVLAGNLAAGEAARWTVCKAARRAKLRGSEVRQIRTPNLLTLDQVPLLVGLREQVSLN